MANSEYRNSIFSIDIGYGSTPMGPELRMIMYGLNKDYITDSEVLGWAFGRYSSEDMSNYYMFILAFKNILGHLNADIDYSKYTLDMEIGNFLNDVDDAYRTNNMDSIIERFSSGNVSQNVLNNSFAMGIILGYFDGMVLNYDEIVYNLISDIDYVSQVSNGYDYGNSKFKK